MNNNTNRAVYPLTVAITYNLKDPLSVTEDDAEFDDISTIEAIRKALETVVSRVMLVDLSLGPIEQLIYNRPDIVFNIAEGTNGRGREAQIPAILSFLDIPYTGSDETTMCLTLDKTITKLLAKSSGIRTPKWVTLETADDEIPTDLHYPVIVKPNAEGSSKGISSDSVVYDRIQLEAMLMSRFKQKETLLVEEFIEGREFTVGILGNGKDIKVFEPMEIVFKDKNHSVYGYDIKQNFQEYIEYTVTSKIPHAVIRELSDMAGKAFKLFGCKDMARVDFRVNEFNEVYFIEINPLPGLAPGYSDFPMIAEFSGIGYTSLIVQILKTAMMRYSLNSYIALSCEAEGGNK